MIDFSFRISTKYEFTFMDLETPAKIGKFVIAENQTKLG